MRINFAFLLLLLLGCRSQAQVPQGFEAYHESVVNKARTFTQALFTVDSLLQRQAPFETVAAALKALPCQVEADSVGGVKQLVALSFFCSDDEAALLKSMLDEGKLPALGALANAQKLLFTPNLKAHIDQMPRKTGNADKDNDYYLSVIKQLITKNSSKLGKFNFESYKALEAKNCDPENEFDLFRFRSTFIKFLYEKYQIVYKD